MKKTLNIDGKLLEEAKLASGAATDAQTVHMGLEALVRRARLSGSVLLGAANRRLRMRRDGERELQLSRKVSDGVGGYGEAACRALHWRSA